MIAETKSLSVTAFKNEKGQPCCAANFETGEVCMFYRTRSFGTHETCVFAKDGPSGLPVSLHRRHPNGTGTLIPLDNCPVWQR